MKDPDSIPGCWLEKRVAEPNGNDENYADPVRWCRERNLESAAKGTDAKCDKNGENFFHELGEYDCGRRFSLRKAAIYPSTL